LRVEGCERDTARTSLSKASSETEERRLPKELKMSAHAMMDVLSTALRGLFIVFTTASTTFSLPPISHTK
jgi:hypothetical protein